MKNNKDRFGLILRRLLAGILEGALPLLVSYILIEHVPNKTLEVNTSYWQTGYFIFVVIFWLTTATYFLFKDAMFNGQSLAKWIFGLRVVDVYTRVKCRWWQSFARNIVLFIPGAVILEFLLVIFNPSGRRLGDMIARTIVAKAADEFRPKPKPVAMTTELFLKAITGIMALVFVLVMFSYIFGYIKSRDLTRRISTSDESVVMLFTYSNDNQVVSYGSGFFVNPDGVILTNVHVLNGAYQAFVLIKGKNVLPVKVVIALDKMHDIAVLQVGAKNTPYLKLGDSDNASMGDDIYTIGSPVGLAGTVSKGIISQIRVSGLSKLLQTDAAISPGSSGGPMLNRDLEVIGINVAFMKEGQNLNFAIPINYARRVLDSSKIKYSK
jgi:S1-C subfamily serine protease